MYGLVYCLTWVYTDSELLPGGWFMYLDDNSLFNVTIQSLFFALSLCHWYSVNWHLHRLDVFLYLKMNRRAKLTETLSERVRVLI